MSKHAHPVYTGTGDDGETGLFGGPRVAKDHPRIAAFGSVDELNAFVGLAVAAIETAGSGATGATREALDGLIEELVRVQHRLFDLGAYLATPPRDGGAKVPNVSAEDCERCERAMDRWSEELPPLKNFVLPGGGPAGAALHAARAVCRRAERELIGLHHAEPVAREALVFVNRLSDLFFVAARRFSAVLGIEECVWKKGG